MGYSETDRTILYFYITYSRGVRRQFLPGVQIYGLYVDRNNASMVPGTF
jgi:hypothetical protein